MAEETETTVEEVPPVSPHPAFEPAPGFQPAPVDIKADDEKKRREKLDRLAENRRISRAQERFDIDPSAPAAEVRGSRLADDLAGGFPEMTMPGDEVDPGSEHDTSRENANGSTTGIESDSEGTSFDSERHKSDSNGIPLKDGQGRFKRRNRRNTSQTKSAPSGPPQPDEYDMLANVVMGIETQALAIIFNPEEVYTVCSADKTNEIRASWASYLRSKQVSFVSPGAMLIMAHIGMIGAIVAQPESQKKAKKYADKAMGFVMGKKKKPKVDADI